MRMVQGGGAAWKEALRSQLPVGKLYLSTPEFAASGGTLFGR
jgi:hypothetical protein